MPENLDRSRWYDLSPMRPGEFEQARSEASGDGKVTEMAAVRKGAPEARARLSCGVLVAHAFLLTSTTAGDCACRMALPLCISLKGVMAHICDFRVSARHDGTSRFERVPSLGMEAMTAPIEQDMNRGQQKAGRISPPRFSVPRNSVLVRLLVPGPLVTPRGHWADLVHCHLTHGPGSRLGGHP